MTAGEEGKQIWMSLWYWPRFSIHAISFHPWDPGNIILRSPPYVHGPRRQGPQIPWVSDGRAMLNTESYSSRAHRHFPAMPGCWGEILYMPRALPALALDQTLDRCNPAVWSLWLSDHRQDKWPWQSRWQWPRLNSKTPGPGLVKH